jgi:hypothetical protein
MNEPIYKPENWVTFQQGEEGGFGRIVGGSYDGETWHYTVAGSLADGSHQSVKEGEIGFLFQNGSWLAPTSSGGHASIYKDI